MKTEKEALLYVKNLLVEAIDAMHETGDIEEVRYRRAEPFSDIIDAKRSVEATQRERSS